ncbi:MAG: PepSY-associated TM helix domain-containing protein [Cyclobacteriaceae bacterium]
MTKEKRPFSWRKLFNDIHLWLGIGSGLILFLVCLSGTVYTFRSEIERALEADKYKAEAKAGVERLTVEQIVRKTEAETGGKVSSVAIPHAEDETYRLSVKTSPEERRGTGYFIDPYTAEIKGTSGGPASEFFMVMFRMHRWLLMDSSIGRPIVGTATVIFVFILLTGIVLWFPKKLKNWKQGLKIKTDSNWKRINHDLHNTLGFYSFILLLVMSLTGLCWSFEWYRDGLGAVLGAEVFGGRGEKPPVSDAGGTPAATLSAEEFISIADKQLLYEGDYRISLPGEPEAPVVIMKTGVGFFASSGRDVLYLNQYSGEVLKADIFSEKPFNQKITSSIKPLHTGEILGTFSKILYFIACLVATSLPVTGTIIWLNKLKKKAKRKNKKKRAVVAG